MKNWLSVLAVAAVTILCCLAMIRITGKERRFVLPEPLHLFPQGDSHMHSLRWYREVWTAVICLAQL